MCHHQLKFQPSHIQNSKAMREFCTSLLHSFRESACFLARRPSLSSKDHPVVPCLGWKLSHCTFPNAPTPEVRKPPSPHQCLDLLAVFVLSRSGSLERRFGFQGLERLKGGAISKSISPFCPLLLGREGGARSPRGRFGSFLYLGRSR
jgi:hypothetical protein